MYYNIEYHIFISSYNYFIEYRIFISIFIEYHIFKINKKLITGQLGKFKFNIYISLTLVDSDKK